MGVFLIGGEGRGGEGIYCVFPPFYKQKHTSIETFVRLGLANEKACVAKIYYTRLGRAWRGRAGD